MATNIKELTENIEKATKLIETEIRELKSARERIETVQGVGQNLVNGFTALYDAVIQHTTQQQSMLENGSTAQLRLIEQKFVESFKELSTTQRQLTEFVNNYDGIIAEVNQLRSDLTEVDFRSRFAELQTQVVQPLGLLDKSLFELQSINRIYFEEISKLNLAVRLDKLDATIAGINAGLLNILNQFNTANTDTKGLLIGINSTLAIAAKNTVVQSNCIISIVEKFQDKQEIKWQQQNKRLSILQGAVFTTLALFVLIILIIVLSVLN